MSKSMLICLLLSVALLGLFGCASGGQAAVDGLAATAAFLREHKPTVVGTKACQGFRFEEGGAENGRLVVEIYPPCEAPKAP